MLGKANQEKANQEKANQEKANHPVCFASLASTPPWQEGSFFFTLLYFFVFDLVNN
jgi:hypothetical protein